MAWHCPLCFSTRAIFDLSTDEAEPVGCLQCNWDDVVGTNDYGKVTRCIAPTLNTITGAANGRCTRTADVGGYCWQHQNQRPDFWDEVCRTFRTRANVAGLPDAYREMFGRAIRDAGLAADTNDDVRGALQRVKRARGASVVYFVEREALVKIGVTTNLANRLKAIGKGSSMPPGMTIGPVQLLATVPGDRHDEDTYHARFRQQRIKGTEWFRPNKALRHLIEDLNRARERGTPDVLDAALDRTA